MVFLGELSDDICLTCGAATHDEDVPHRLTDAHEEKIRLNMARLSKQLDAWIRVWDNSSEYVENVNGVAWHDAPKPWRWHRCKPQTRGRFHDLAVDRCACGGVRYVGDSFWIERNSRRRK